VTVEDNDRLIDKATIVLEDPQGTTVDIPSEGQKVRIDMGWAGSDNHTVIFEGLVTSVPARAAGAGTNGVTIIAFDPAWRMMQANASNPDTETHNPKPPRALPAGKLSAILERMIGHYNIPKGIIRCEPDPEFTEQRPLWQRHETDWEFIQRMAQDYSARAYVEYNGGAAKFYFQPESTLVQGDPMGTLHYCRGFSQLVEFRYQRIASGASAQTAGSVADPGSGVAVSSAPVGAPTPDPTVTPDPDVSARLSQLNPQLSSEHEQALTAAQASPDRPADQRPAGPSVGNPSDPGLPDRISRRDPTRLLGFLGEGTAVGTIMLRAKGKVTITGIAAWAEGDWYVRKAVHVYTRVIERMRDSRTDQITTRDRSTYQTKFTVTR
jgi:phage protein D